MNVAQRLQQLGALDGDLHGEHNPQGVTKVAWLRRFRKG
jgi:hypothetical protein